jgi:hypothetical protein
LTQTVLTISTQLPSTQQTHKKHTLPLFNASSFFHFTLSPQPPAQTQGHKIMSSLPAISDLNFHTYRRYKTWMSIFITWLAKAARGTDEVPEIFGDPVQAFAGSAKGKQKKKGKATKAPQKRKEKGKTHMIQCGQLERLAEVIAGADGVEVPEVSMCMQASLES